MHSVLIFQNKLRNLISTPKITEESVNPDLYL